MSKHIDSASTVLKIGVLLSVKRGMFGTLRPTERQLGWSFGFCDGFAQSSGMGEDEDFILFISMVFERVFGKSGLSYFRKVAMAQDHYIEEIREGGTAHHKSLRDGTPPLIPLSG